MRIACYRRTLELEPDSAVAHSNLLLTLHYCPGVTPAELADAHADFDRRHAAPLAGAWEAGENPQPRCRDFVRISFRPIQGNTLSLTLNLAAILWQPSLKHWPSPFNTIKPAGCKRPSKSIAGFWRPSRITPTRSIFSA